MNVRTKNFVRSKFKEYYQMATLEMPPELNRREWGFIFFDRTYPTVTMHRHKSFGSVGEAISYIKEMVPAHVYYSSALYLYPGARSMSEKEWIGADLIFDLDADHLRCATGSYANMLELVKLETIKLLDFLRCDFGFKSNMIELVFSGGRGYHVHIMDPRVKSLGSPERREIIDYLRGTGFDYDRFLVEKTILGADERKRKTLKISADTAWGKKIHSRLTDLLDKISEMEEDEAISELIKIETVGKKEAKKIIKLSKEKDLKDDVKKGFIGFKGFSKNFWKNLVDGLKLDIEGESDEPVTSDIKRLIRFPTSIHGGSGLKVMPIDIDLLEKFDPLCDAVVFGENAVNVEVTKPCTISIKNKDFFVEEGKRELPEYAAMFLMCRGMAEFRK